MNAMHRNIYSPAFEVVSPSGWRCAIFAGPNAEERAYNYARHNAPIATSGELSRVIRHEGYKIPPNPFPCDIPA